jgi:hypothetical protein
MRIDVEVLRIDHPTLVEVTYTPRWWERMLGRRSYSRMAAPIGPNSGLWQFDTPNHTVDDETYAAITAEMAAAILQRQRDEPRERELAPRPQLHVVK